MVGASGESNIEESPLPMAPVLTLHLRSSTAVAMVNKRLRKRRTLRILISWTGSNGIPLCELQLQDEGPPRGLSQEPTDPAERLGHGRSASGFLVFNRIRDTWWRSCYRIKCWPVLCERNRRETSVRLHGSGSSYPPINLYHSIRLWRVRQWPQRRKL